MAVVCTLKYFSQPCWRKSSWVSVIFRQRYRAIAQSLISALAPEAIRPNQWKTVFFLFLPLLHSLASTTTETPRHRNGKGQSTGRKAGKYYTTARSPSTSQDEPHPRWPTQGSEMQTQGICNAEPGGCRKDIKADDICNTHDNTTSRANAFKTSKESAP